MRSHPDSTCYSNTRPDLRPPLPRWQLRSRSHASPLLSFVCLPCDLRPGGYPVSWGANGASCRRALQRSRKLYTRAADRSRKGGEKSDWQTALRPSPAPHTPGEHARHDQLTAELAKVVQNRFAIEQAEGMIRRSTVSTSQPLSKHPRRPRTVYNKLLLTARLPIPSEAAVHEDNQAV